MNINEQMIEISKTLYLQTRYAQCELTCLDGISPQDMNKVCFELRILDDSSWVVKTWDRSGEELKKDIARSLQNNSQGILIIGADQKQFRGLLFATEGVIADFSSTITANIQSWSIYDTMEECLEEQPGSYYKIETGDPLHIPRNWNNLMIDQDFE